MKKCAICNSEYDSRIEYCFRDGSLLDQGSTTSAPKMVTSQLSSMEDPMDMMQTLDNISIDDILQIGGQGGFQGFGQFTPIKAPASKDGDTLSMSRSSLREMLESEERTPNSNPVESVDSEQGLGGSANQDVEDVLDSFGSEIGAHLDDTLDGVQVGQLMDDSGLNFDDTNEILPGDTLDVMVDDLDVPEMSEGDLGRFNQQNASIDDKWEASGPIMQDAARQALEEHRKRSSHKENPAVASGVASAVVEEPKPVNSSGSKTPILIGAAVLFIGCAGWLFSGSSTDEKGVQSPPKVKREIAIPTVKQRTKNGTPVNTDAPDNPNAKEPEQAKPSSVDEMGTTVGTSQGVNVAPQDTNSDKGQGYKNQGYKNQGYKEQDAKTTSQKPKPPQKPTPAPKKKSVVKPPPKPKTTPKPMPKKDPVEDNGWQVQSGGWGVSTCGVTVRSNVASAEVFIDGVRTGKVGSGLTVDCGKHTLEVRSEGYTTKERQIDLMTDATYSIDLDLIK